MSDPDEIPKAVGEVAKASGKAIDLTTKVGSFISKIFGPASEQLGGVVEDWAKYFRAKNLLAISDRVEAIRAKRNQSGKPLTINPSLGIPLLEAASIAEDDVLRDMWAELISSATDPDEGMIVRKLFVDLLSSLDPIDAEILLWISSQGWNNALGNIDPPSIAVGVSTSEDEVLISLRNLSRLALVENGILDTPEGVYVASNSKVRSRIAPLGVALLKACASSSKTDGHNKSE